MSRTFSMKQSLAIAMDVLDFLAHERECYIGVFG